MFSLRDVFILIAVIVAATHAGLAYPDAMPHPDPSKKIKVFLFAGQSNREGRADANKLTHEEQVRLRNVQDRIWLAFNGQPIRPLEAYTPSSELQEIYQRTRMFGPELFFGIALAEAWPEEKFLFIKRAEGATSLHGRWNPDWSQTKAVLMGEADAPPLYQDFVDYTHKLIGAYAPDAYEIVALLWVQGESDGKVPEAAAGYGDTLRILIERTRTDIGPDDLPVIFFQVG